MSPQFDSVAGRLAILPTSDRLSGPLLGAEPCGVCVETQTWSLGTPGGALPSIPLSFSLATILPPEPKNFDFSQGAGGVIDKHPPIPSRHRLWLRLGRYLIVFEPPTFVLD